MLIKVETDMINNEITFYYKKLGTEQVVFINGTIVQPAQDDKLKFVIPSSLIKAGKNNVTIVTPPIHKEHDWDKINSEPGVIQVIKKAEPWKRKLFNGYAQLIVQANGEEGEITVVAASNGLKKAEITLQSKGKEQ